MTEWPELTVSLPIPGEPSVLVDGRPTLLTAAPGANLDWSDAFANWTAANRPGGAFRSQWARSLEEVAAPIEMGRAVLLAVNLGLVKNSSAEAAYGDANGVVRVAAIARDPVHGELQGFVLADRVREWFSSVDELREGWLDTGGWMMFTNRALTA